MTGHRGPWPAEWRWAGQLAMAAAVSQNLDDLRAVQAGAAPRVLAFEPDQPTLTLGRRAHGASARAQIGATLELAAARGWPVLDVDRGGLATLHLPGQVVLLLALPVAATQLRQLVRDLLQAAADTAASSGTSAELRADTDAGLWLGPAKLASIGLCHRGGVASHGMALNAAIDTGYGGGLTLCGHSNAQLASLYPHRGGDPDRVAQVAQALCARLGFLRQPQE